MVFFSVCAALSRKVQIAKFLFRVLAGILCSSCLVFLSLSMYATLGNNRKIASTIREEFICWCKNMGIVLEELSQMGNLFGIWDRKDDF